MKEYIKTSSKRALSESREKLLHGKNVFIEKPLALTIEEIILIDKAYQDSKYSKLMVGFNRRFAPHIIKMKELLVKRKSPKSIIMTINGIAWKPDSSL